jgi:hypothetical protein
MNKKIMLATGFEDAVAKFENSICPFCDEEINKEDFKDELSLKEYFISGICYKCQLKIFGK